MTPQDQGPVRLKGLELIGYKTFATKTTFEFAPTITAIVGPNGSGKSNIADAIRWVLGEQAYSLLRGKKTEDMIFSGSEARSRAGMASATITFDNSGGWLPIDFNEVTVGRRAYRDGQNEYLINGQRVRLRDVGELLAESGLAERTYTVIGQGLVDAVLALRAEERRELFEEAAGIGLYRSRREEAVRRLESTRRNLERVQDILAELRPRLRSLERQAQRARDYRQVKRDLQSSLRLLYGFHWNRMQSVVRDARRAALEEGKKREILLQKQQAVDEELKSTRERIATLRERLQGWSGEASTLFERREELGRHSAVVRERIRWLGEQREMLQSEVDSLEADEAILEKSVDVARVEVKELEAEVQRYEGPTVSDGATGMTLRDRRELQEEMDERRRELENLSAREASWRTEEAQLKERKDELRERLTVASEERSNQEGHLSRLEEEAAAARRELDQLREAQASLGEELAETRSGRAELGIALDEKRQRLAEVKAELARMDSRMGALRELAEGSQAGARALLTAAERGQLKGVVGRVVADVQVQRQFREAVLTALGEILGGLALRSRADLAAALSLLEGEASAGRTVLLSVDPTVQPSKEEAPDEVGVIGNASDYVESDTEVGSIVKLLLRRTWIVEDREVAMRLRANEGAATVQLVTRRGELFRTDGTVVVGAPVLGPSREEQEALRREHERAQVRLEELTEAVNELEEKVRARETHAQGLEDQLEGLRGEGDEAAARLQSLELERRGFVARVESMRDREGTLQQELEDVRERLRAVRSEAEAFEDERARLERHLGSLRRRLDMSEREDLHELEGEWQVARQGKSEAEARLKERQSRLERMREELDQWRQRIGGTEEELEERSSELESVESEAERVETSIEQSQGEITPAEAALREAESQRSELETEESRLRFELQSVENRHSQAQVELARREEEMHGLQRRVEDDFGLVAYEYDEDTTGQEPLPLEGLVEKLPAVEELPEGHETQVKRLRAQLRRMGSINPEAQQEYKHVKDRVAFMTTQVDDLREAESQIQEVIAELDVIMAREFRKTFDAVATAFRETFRRLFGGGSARLTLSDPDDPNESGIEIEARLPGKREQGLAVLSGGERSLTASALIFALLRVSPTPFCVLDEVDAMLDEVNVGRFCELLQELSERTQFVVITHNRLTVQVAQAVYGVSMSADTTSKVISLDLEEAAREVAA